MLLYSENSHEGTGCYCSTDNTCYVRSHCMHQKEVGRICLRTDLLGYTGCHRNGRCKLSGGKINPLIGSAGVSAVPMAARVSQKVGAEADPTNFLLMHAMGPNVAGVIGTAVAAGTFMAIFGV